MQQIFYFLTFLLQNMQFLIAEFLGPGLPFSQGRRLLKKFFLGPVFDCWISGARTSFSARTQTSKEIFSGARTPISGVFDCWISGARTSFSVSLGGNADFSGPTLISPSFAMVLFDFFLEVGVLVPKKRKRKSWSQKFSNPAPEKTIFRIDGALV